MRFRLHTLLIVLTLGSVVALVLAALNHPRPPYLVGPTKAEAKSKEAVHRRMLAGERHEQLMKLRRSGKSIEK